MARGAGVSLTYGTVVVSTSKQSKMLVPVDCPKSTRRTGYRSAGILL
jgi:hypothetical protein